MAQQQDDEGGERPLDPAVERVRRKLVRFVAINLGLLFLALMAVVAAIVYRANRIEAPPSGPIADLPAPEEGDLVRGEIPLPDGARILGHALSGGRISIHVDLGGGRGAIILYDMGADRIIGRFDILTTP